MKARRLLRTAGVAIGVTGLIIATLGATGGIAGASLASYSNYPSGTAVANPENCQSLAQGAKTPKVDKTITNLNTSGTFYPGQTVDYAINLIPPPTSTYALRDCLNITDATGKYLSTLDSAEFDNITAVATNPTYSYDYTLPAAFANDFQPGNKVCNVAKTIEKLTNGITQNRKTNGACFTIVTPPTLAVTKKADASSVQEPGAIGFTIEVKNTGGADATGFSLVDPLPTNTDLNWSIDKAPKASVMTCDITGAAGAQAVECPAGGGTQTLAGGASFTVHVTSATTANTAASAVAPNGAGVAYNEVTVSASNATNSPQKAHDQETVTTAAVVGTPNIQIDKSADAATVTEPADVGFMITVSNTGAATANSTTLSDTLPANTDLSWSIDGPNTTATGCAISGGKLTCGPQDVAAGGSYQVHITSPTTAATATSDTGHGAGVVYNTAEAKSGAQDVTDSASSTVHAPGLMVAKSPDLTPINTGDQAGYTIEVSDPGTAATQSINLTDTLPTNSGLSWSIDPAGTTGTGCSISKGVLTCGPQDLTAGSDYTVHLVSPTTCATAGRISNSASATASGGLSDSAGPAVITVNASGCGGGGPVVNPPVVTTSPSLSMTKTADAVSVPAGQQVGFTVTLKNTGSGSATGALISDPLPSNSGLAWTIDTPNTTAPNCSISNNTLTCGPGTLAAGASWSVHVTSLTNAATCTSGPIVNTATGTGTNATQVQATATTGATCVLGEVLAPDPRVTKTPDANSVAAGQPVGFTITLTNPGTAATTAQINDPLPINPGLSWTIDSQPVGGPVCSITAGNLVCGPANLAVGQTWKVHISSPTTPTTCGNVTNVVTIIAPGISPNRTASATETVTCVLGISVTPPPAPTPAPKLPFTGTPATTNVVGGLVAAALGGILVLAARPRRRRA